MEIIGSQTLFKWNRESWDSEKPIPSNVDTQKDHVKQPSISIGKIKKLKKDITIPIYELCGRKHTYRSKLPKKC